MNSLKMWCTIENKIRHCFCTCSFLSYITVLVTNYYFFLFKSDRKCYPHHHWLLLFFFLLFCMFFSLLLYFFVCLCFLFTVAHLWVLIDKSPDLLKQLVWSLASGGKKSGLRALKTAKQHQGFSLFFDKSSLVFHPWLYYMLSER